MSERSAARLRPRDLTLIALFTALMAVCAWIYIPVPAPLVHFSMHTFAVFAALMILGGKRGTWVITAYLLLGAVGAPVFSGFRGGPGVLLGATGGYIVGFVFTGLLYWLMTAKLGEALLVRIAAGLLGMFTYYAFGTAWYLVLYASTGSPVSLMTALGYCVFPFVLPDLVKLALALLLARRVVKYV